MKYRKLICFDFDDTLFHTPLPEEGKKTWKERTGTEWPYRGWWGRAESIGFTPEGKRILAGGRPVFDIPKNEWIYGKYLEAVSEKEKGEGGVYLIMATGRLNKSPGMREGIEQILRENNMEFDEVHLNWGEDTFEFKRKLFEKMMRKTGAESLTMYDDREEHLPRFESWAEESGARATIVDAINKTRKEINKKAV